jgi:hypothetical protein
MFRLGEEIPLEVQALALLARDDETDELSPEDRAIVEEYVRETALRLAER